MSINNSGSWNRLSYDTCAYQKKVAQSTGSLEYQMYAGKYENDQRCVANDKSNWKPFDDEIITRENELSGRSKRATKCPQYQHSPNCDRSSGICISTYDNSNPIVMPSDACSITPNNLIRPSNPGYVLNVGRSSTPKYRYPN